MINETNVSLIRNLLGEFSPERKGWLNEKEVEKISRSLKLDERDVLNLKNLRDCVVLFLLSVKDNKPEEEKFKITDLISGITSVIDRFIFKLDATCI